ncbi:MAG: DUF4430 domain-containing protein [Peptococcales bacterium]|jgi:hypothetical protein
MRKKLGLILIVLVIFLLSGCGANIGEKRDNSTTEQINLVITRDFGKEKILTKEITIEPNMTVMDLLFKADLEVKAGYSGSFVDGINGLLTKGAGLGGERWDWFYFVNGIFADVGAMDYFPQPGDVIWWDYRPWKATGASPNAVIGAFPETFQYGYLNKTNPTRIMAFKEDLDLAKGLKGKLEELGVSQIEIIDISEEKIKNPQGPTILLGAWNLLKEIDYVSKLNENYPRAGFYGFFSDNGLNLLSHDLKLVKTASEKAGLIISTAQGNGDTNPLWIVTGIDQEGFSQGVRTLINSHEKLRQLYNAAIVNGEVISLPLENNI